MVRRIPTPASSIIRAAVIPVISEICALWFSTGSGARNSRSHPPPAASTTSCSGLARETPPCSRSSRLRTTLRATVASSTSPSAPSRRSQTTAGRSCPGSSEAVPSLSTVGCSGTRSSGQDRPAVVWDLRLGADGEVEEATVARSVVRSREQLDYPTEQARLDAGTAGEVLRLLVEVGTLRSRLE